MCACVCVLHSSLSHMQVCVSVVTKALIHGGELPTLTLCKRPQVCFCVSRSILLLVCMSVFDWVCVNE